MTSRTLRTVSMLLLCLALGRTAFAAVDNSLTMTPSTSAVDAQEDYSYNLTINNLGSTASSSLTLNETVPLGTYFTTVGSSAGWSCSNGAPGGTACSLTIGSLGAGASVSKTFAVHATYAYPPAGDPSPITNAACAVDPADSNLPNNCATTTLPTTFTSMYLTLAGYADLDASGNISCGDVLHMKTGVYPGNSSSNIQNTGLLSTLWVAPQPPDTTLSSGWGLVGGTGAPDFPFSTCTISVLHGQNPGDAYLQARTQCPPPPSTLNGDISTFDFDINVSSTAGTMIVDGIAHTDDGFNLRAQLPITVAVPCVLAPDLAVTKTLSSGTVLPGAVLVYNLALQNLGNQVAGSPTLTDTVPANSTFNSASSSAGWSCANGAPAGTVCTIVLPNLGGGSSTSRTFAVTLDSPLPPAVTQVANTACASTLTSGDPTGNNCSTITTPRAGQPNMTLTKTASPSPIGPAQTLVYTLAYSNSGTASASGVTLTETVPANSTFSSTSSSAGWSCANGSPAGTACSLAIGTVAAGGSGSKAFAVLVVNPIPAGVTSIGNTACAHPASGDADPSNDCSTISTPTGAPNVSLTKTAAPNPVSAGQTLTYTLAYANGGTSTAQAVVLSETVPANTTYTTTGSSAGWSCSNGAPAGTACTLALGDLAAGANGSKTFAVVVASPIPVGVTTIGNTACAHPTPASTDSAPANDCSSISTPTSGPNMTLTKTSNATSAAAGQTLTYTLGYQNIGNAAATSVNLSETVPTATTFTAASSSAGWSCANGSPAGTTCTLSLGTVAAGASGTKTLSVTVLTPIPAGTSAIGNTACATLTGDTDPSNDCSTVSTPTALPDLTASKTALPSPVTPGHILVYTITYQNAGGASANSAVLQETVPTGTTFSSAGSSAGWSCSSGAPAGTACTLSLGTLARAANGSKTFAVLVDVPLAPGVTQIANTVCARPTPASADANAANDCGSASTPVDLQPDLGLVKTGQPDIAPPGSVLVYTLTYDNHGTATATAAVLQETVPSQTTFNAGASSAGWSCADGAVAGTVCNLTIGDVAVSTGGSKFFAVNIPNPVTVPTVINNACVNPTPASADADSSDNCATATNGAGAPNLVVTKTALPSPVDAGQALTYTITVQNTGAQPAPSVVATETVPANTTFVPASSSPSWSCTPDNNAGATCSAMVGALAPNATATLTFVAQVASPLPPGTTSMGNTACATYDDGSSPVLGRRQRLAASTPVCDSVDTPIGGAVNLTLTKDDHGTSAHAGDRVWYFLDYTNIGNRTATGVSIAETVPLHSTFVSSSSTPGWSCADGSVGGIACTLSLPALAQGDTGEAVFAVMVEQPTTATALLNTAAIADDHSHGADADPANNTASDTTPILAADVHDIPTLGELGLIALAFTLAAYAISRVRAH